VSICAVWSGQKHSKEKPITILLKSVNVLYKLYSKHNDISFYLMFL